MIAVCRNGKATGQTVPIEDKGVAGHLDGDASVFQVVVQVILNPLISRAEVICEESR